MIISEQREDLFQCGMQTVVCSTNTIGAMGKGIAVEFRNRVPGLYRFYQGIYNDIPPNYHKIHRLEVFDVDDKRKVLLFPTKDNWRFPSKLPMIDANLRQLAERYEEFGITSIGLPLIGCGHNTGQLNWGRQVRPLVYQHLDPLPIPVKICIG